MGDNRLEYLVVKYSLGFVFFFVTLEFAVKILELFIAYFQSGQAGTDIKEWLLHFVKK